MHRHVQSSTFCVISQGTVFSDVWVTQPVMFKPSVSSSALLVSAYLNLHVLHPDIIFLGYQNTLQNWSLNQVCPKICVLESSTFHQY